MSLLQTLTVFELIDNAHVSGQDIVDLFADYPSVTASTHRASGAKGATDFIRITIPGSAGKSLGAMRLRWVSSVVLAASVHAQRALVWFLTVTAPSLPSAVH